MEKWPIWSSSPRIPPSKNCRLLQARVRQRISEEETVRRFQTRRQRWLSFQSFDCLDDRSLIFDPNFAMPCYLHTYIKVKAASKRLIG